MTIIQLLENADLALSLVARDQPKDDEQSVARVSDARSDIREAIARLGILAQDIVSLT